MPRPLPPGEYTATYTKDGMVKITGLPSLMEQYAASAAKLEAELAVAPPPVQYDPHTGRRLPRTQKARGIVIAASSVPSFAGVKTCPSPFVFGLDAIPKWEHFPMFARPCPIRPRHGFVESGPVQDWWQVQEKYRETLLADPQGELVLMPVLTGVCSAVATNAGVTWGHGNDGVTNASGKTFLIPAPSTADRWNRSLLDGPFGYGTQAIGINNCTYVELVEHEGHMRVVQYRDGPAQDTATDFLPRPGEKIGRVLMRNGESLLEWETYLKHAVLLNGGPEGLVVFLPFSPLSSHWAVHAIELGMTVITGPVRPEEGHIIEGETKVPFMGRSDFVSIAARIREWWDRDYFGGTSKQEKGTVATAVATVHSQGLWDGDFRLNDLRAQAVVTLIRANVAACMGEMRHWWDNGPGRNDGPEPVTEFPKNIQGAWERLTFSRNNIYQYYLRPRAAGEYMAVLTTMARDFKSSDWPRGQYGGPGWAEIAKQTQRLVSAIEPFMRNQNAETWKEIAMIENTLVHTAHNGGTGVTKWLTTDGLSAIATAPAIGFMNLTAGRCVLDVSGNTEDRK